MQIIILKEVTDKDIANLLDEASRGSTYWASEVSDLGYESVVKNILTGKKVFTIKDYEDNDKIYQLNLDAIKSGLEIMADKFPKVFAEVLLDNTDAGTGDIFLQCALLGEVLYG